MSGWRTWARQVIQEVIDARGDESVEEVMSAIDAAHPFGARDHWPYTVWLQERRGAIARLRGQALTYDAKQRPLAPPYVPAPELEAWLLRRDEVEAARVRRLAGEAV